MLQSTVWCYHTLLLHYIASLKNCTILILLLDQNKESLANFQDFSMWYSMTPCGQLTAHKKCVATASAKEGFSTQKIAKKLNYYYSTLSRMIKLKCEIGDIERKSGSGQKKATGIAEERYL